jgi:sugar phosphate permease
MLAANLIENIGWRWTFAAFGLVGLVWAAAFLSWFRDDPADHPAVNDAELRLIGSARQQPHADPIPWQTVFANRNIWLLGGIMTLASFVSYFYFSWYPSYLEKARGISKTESGTLSSLVLGLAAFGTLGGGFLANWVNQRPRRQALRSGICSGLFAASAGFLVASVWFDDVTLSACFAGLSCACMFSYQAHWWAATMELTGKHLGALFGLLNGMGVVGAMSSQFFFGWFGDFRASLGYAGREQWDPAFCVYLVVLGAGALAWLFVDTTHPLRGAADEPV